MKTSDPTEWATPETKPMHGQCKYCKGLLIGGRKDRKFCDAACAAQYQRQQWRLLNPKSPAAAMQNNTVAEANEMRVAIDLLERGYSVYRAAVQGMPCDLLIRGGTVADVPWGTLRIEVTTGHRTASGTVVHPKRDTSQYDVIAIVIGGNEIFYKPDLEA